MNSAAKRMLRCNKIKEAAGFILAAILVAPIIWSMMVVILQLDKVLQ